MKKLFTLLAIACIGTMSFGQTIFQSNFDNWTTVAPIVPTDFNGPHTNIDTDSITKITSGTVYGPNAVELQNSGSSGKRFTTQPLSVTNGTTYQIKFWAKGDGSIATRLWAGSYIGSVNYIVVNSNSWAMYTQNVTSDSTMANAEFMFYARLTNPAMNNIQLDSVEISVSTAPPVTFKKIYDIQYPANANGDSPELGNIVTTKGVVTGIVKNGPGKHSFFIQDSARAYNGLYIYELNDSSLVIGDSVEVTGTVDEFNLGTAPQKLTEIKSVSNITVLNSGNPLPTPVNITTANGNMEEWEGVLVSVTNAQCTSNSVGFGKWSLDDGSGVINADDDIFPYALSANVGTYYDVTGIGHYFFDEYVILPRDANDISVSTAVEELNNIEAIVYPNPVKDNLNIELNVSGFSLRIMDVTGKTINTASSLTNKLSISTSSINNGIYFYSIYDADGNIITTNRFIVSK